MQRTLTILALVFFSLALPARNKSDKDVGLKYLDANFKTYDTLQKRIHSYAEEGFHEYRSSEALASHLEENGFSIERGAAGMPTAFVATFGSGHPVIAILAEFDALPGLSQDTVSFRKPLVEGGYGHGCGHNLLGTGSTAAAVAISKWLSCGHTGTVKLYGCPAEEGGGGKNYMVDAGCFDGVDVAFDWHPAQDNGVSQNMGLANLNVLFEWEGVTAHASAQPWEGRSALDALEAFDYMMNMMREHIAPSCRIHYVIKDGGQAPNIVPDHASAYYYFRAGNEKELTELWERALKAAEGAALGTGTTLKYEILAGNWPRYSNLALNKLMLKNFNKVGGVVLDEREKKFAGDMLTNCGLPLDRLGMFEYIRQEIPSGRVGGVSSDVGAVSVVVPTSRLVVAACVAAGGGHSWQQTATAGTTIGTKGALTAARIFYLTALDIFTDPACLKAIEEEFEETHKDLKFRMLTGDRKPPLDFRF